MHYVYAYADSTGRLYCKDHAGELDDPITDREELTKRDRCATCETPLL